MAQDNEIKKISDLVPDAGNYNRGTEKGRKLIGKSLKKFGAGRSILIDKDGNVIAGNKTLEGAATAGIDEVIVVKTTGRQIVAVQRTDLEIGSKKGREMALADNATGAANLSWDLEMMAADGWTEKDLEGWGVDLAGVEVGRPEAVEDDYEIPEEIKTDIVAGDLFEIGAHRLLCGDSTKAEDVDRLMNGDGADMVFIDPPYGVSYASKNEYLNTISPGNRIQVPIENDHMSLSDTSDFILLLFKQLKRILKKRSSYYITAPQGGDLMMMMMTMMREAGIPLRHCLIWAKNNHVLGRCDYMYKHEPILYGWVDVHDFYGEGSQKFSVWNFDKPLKNDLHPTMKPVPLVGNALLNSILTGNIVADLCLGSGTTMVAAHQLNRRCFGMEIDPKYCQVILDRMRKLAPDLEIRKNGVKYNVDKA